MAPKQEPLFKSDAKMTDIHPVQQRMREFANDNHRCVITSPRRSGKSVFIIMQALLERAPVLILTHNTGAAKLLYDQLRQFCKDNEVPYTQHSMLDNTTLGVSVNNNVIRIVPYQYADRFMPSGQYILFIDEYDLMDLRTLKLQDLSKAVLIGTATGRSEKLTREQIGLFAGLNINGE